MRYAADYRRVEYAASGDDWDVTVETVANTPTAARVAAGDGTGGGVELSQPELDKFAGALLAAAERVGGNAARRSARPTIYDEIRAEREAAHAKHGDTSMEAAPVDEMFRAVILGEEVGEVAEVCYLLWSAALTAKASYAQKAMNDGRHDGAVDLAKLRRELVQVATMAAAWADRIEDTAEGAS